MGVKGLIQTTPADSMTELKGKIKNTKHLSSYSGTLSLVLSSFPSPVDPLYLQKWVNFHVTYIRSTLELKNIEKEYITEGQHDWFWPFCFHGFSTKLDTSVSPLSWYSSSTSKVHSERLLCMWLSPCALYRQSNKTKNEFEETRSDSFNDGQCRSWTRKSHKRRYECPMIPRHFEHKNLYCWLLNHPSVQENRLWIPLNFGYFQLLTQLN